MNAELQRFVREALATGASRDQIRAALGAARWPADEVEAALSAWEDAGLGVPVPRRRMQLSAREAFLYLLLFATLYTVAFNSGAILFQWIEHAFPDPALTDVAQDRMRQTIRFGIASLCVAFPVYLWIARVLGRAVATDPEKRTSAVRRWLTYLTLFLAACVLIGDVIGVVLGLLNGELTARYLLKVAVIAAIAGSLFAHYLGRLRRDESDAPAATGGRSWTATGAGLGVAGVLVVGLLLAGSPGRARREQIDHRRVNDLQQLANAIESYHARNGSLPEQLADLTTSGPVVGANLADPQTGVAYDYVVVDSITYQLCAAFTAPDSLGPWDQRPNAFWRHVAGRSCFVFHVPRVRA